jgi:AcrR family transcriptional regulator
MEKSSEKRSQLQIKRRKQFQVAARELFSKYGYHGTSMQAIAKSAGYSKRTVYLYFQNKDELFVHVGAVGLELLLDQLHCIPFDEQSPEENISMILNTYIEFSKNERSYFRMIFNEATPEIIQNSSPETQARVAELERACMQVVVNVAEKAIEQYMIPAVDPWEAAGIFVGSATGIILLSTGGSQTVFSQNSLEDLAQKAIWALWRGVRSLADSTKV